MSDAEPLTNLGRLYHYEVATEGQILLHFSMPETLMPIHRAEVSAVLRRLADGVEDGSFPNP